MKLYAPLEIEMDQLMVNRLAAVVHQISNGDHAGGAEVVAETSGEDRRVAYAEQVDQLVEREMREQTGGVEVGAYLLLYFFALPPHMQDLLHQRFVEPV